MNHDFKYARMRQASQIPTDWRLQMSKTHRLKWLTFAVFAALCMLLTGCSDDSASSNNQGGDAGWDVGESPDTGACVEGETRPQDCNTCYCDDQGNWECTLMGCLEPDAGPGDAGPQDAGDAQDATTCTEGDTKQVECNACVCDADGSWACDTADCSADDPCAGKTCGEACSTCDPDAGGACPPVMEYCGADGQCTPGGDQTCGDKSCDEGDTKQVECNTCFCDAEGTWACTEQDCTHVTPCVGKTCGERCSTCDPEENGGICPDVLEYCDSNGACWPGTPVCHDVDDPCEGKACGDSCTPYCPPGHACPAVLGFCNADGACSSDVPACGG